MAQRLTPVQWLICGIAALGFAFDIYELLMLPLIVAPALRELVNAQPGTAGLQPLGRPAVLDSRRRRRSVRAAGRLPDRSARPPPRPGLEHPALRLLGVRRRLQHQHLAVHLLPVHDVHRRLRRVRRRGGVAGRAVPRSTNSESACSATRRRSRRLAARWSRRPTPGFSCTARRCRRSMAATKRGATR